MKTVKKVERIYLLDGKLWMPEGEDEDLELEVGSMLYDSRLGKFVELETEKEVRNYTFIDPELYKKMKSIELERK